MKKLFWFWNLLHFYLFAFGVWCYLQFNPLSWLTQTTVDKKGVKRTGQSTFQSIMNDVMNKNDSGHNFTWAGKFINILLIILLATFLFFIGAIFKLDFSSAAIGLVLFIFLVCSLLFNEHIIFKNDKYIVYFKEFRKFDKKQNKIYRWLCFGTLVLIIGLFVTSFLTYGYVMRNR